MAEPRSQGAYRLAFGAFLLFISGWGILGFVDQSVQGFYAEYVFESLAFFATTTLMSVLLVERGWKLRHLGPRSTPA